MLFRSFNANCNGVTTTAPIQIEATTTWQNVPTSVASTVTYPANSRLFITANTTIEAAATDERGEVTAAANPNGSVANIAGICNEARNVVGLMPHPERACEASLGSADGLVMFESVVSALALQAAGPERASAGRGAGPERASASRGTRQ